MKTTEPCEVCGRPTGGCCTVRNNDATTDNYVLSLEDLFEELFDILCDEALDLEAIDPTVDRPAQGGEEKGR